MVLAFCYKALSISFFLTVSASLRHSNKDDKLVLSPVELIDLVREEQKKAVPSGAVKHIITTAASQLDVEEDIDTTECEDAETLKNRKIWSRWSKWGACSVSCGTGVITRRRACVAGRCARGEMEEQRRPCARAPCAEPPACAVEDARDLY